MTTTTENAPKGKASNKAPSHIAYQVREGKNGKSNWNRIGAAWMHKDGEGFRVQLDSIPVNGQVELRKNTPKKTG